MIPATAEAPSLGVDTLRTGLSAGEEALWLLARQAPWSAALNIAAAGRLGRAVPPSALARAFAALVRRHPGLRSDFPALDGWPARRVSEDVGSPLSVVNLRGMSPAARVARLRAAAFRPFDVEAGPLFRAVLFIEGLGPPAGAREETAAEGILLLVIHHLVADFGSLAVITQELGELLAEELDGRPARLPALAAAYPDFVAHEAERIAGDGGEKLLAFWRQELEVERGEVPALELPTDRSRPPVQTFRGETLLRELDAEAVRGGLRRGGWNATPFAVLLSAYQALLARLSGQPRFVVGAPTFRRDRRAWAALVGYTVNPVPLLADLGEQPSFVELVRHNGRRARRAMAGRAMPFSRLVEALGVERRRDRSPLFQTLFTWQRARSEEEQPLAAFALGYPGVRLRRGGLVLDSVALGQEGSQFDLSLMLTELPADRSRPGEPEGPRLAAALNFNSDLFDHTTAERWLGHFETLLAAALARPETPVGELSLLRPAERQQLIREWGRGAEASATPEGRGDEASLWSLFERRAAAHPDRIALVGEDVRLTYGELARRAAALGTRLRQLGLGPEARVGILLPRTAALPAAILGTLAAGAAYVPLDPAYPEERLAFMLRDSGARLLITGAHTGVSFIPQGLPLLRLATLPPAAAPEPGTSSDSAGEARRSLAYVIYTSGSTGRPKGVGIEHRGALAMARWAAGAFSRAELSGVLASTSVCFDLSVFELFATWEGGGTVILAENALALGTLPARAEVTLINTVPSAMSELLALAAIPRSVRAINLAGEPLRGALVDRLYAVEGIARVRNLYGPSEDTTYSTWTVVPPVAERGVAEPAIGRPVDRSQAWVLDSRLRPVPPGVIGELCLAGAGLARGYLGRPAATAEAFVPWEGGARLYRTGDRARFRADGQLAFLGRRDHQVKIRGFRIEPGEVEAVLAAHPEVAEAVVLVREGPASGGAHVDLRLVAYVAPRELDSGAGASRLMLHLRQQLPAHLVPSALVLLAELPHLPNGKVDRAALPAPDWGEKAGDGGPPPTNATERKLAALWEGLLGVGVPGREADFFSLGGHSLLAARLIARVREAFGVELSLPAIFAHTSLAAMAGQIQAARSPSRAAGPAGVDLGPLRLGEIRAAELGEGASPGAFPLSFAQERLWLLDRLLPNPAVYNIPAGLSLRGSLDVAALAGAWAGIVRRHQSLRTVFPGTRVGEPRSWLRPPAPTPLPVIDLRALAAGAADHAQQLAAAEALRPFDLEAGPLHRALLLRLSPDCHRLLLDVHHIVADGWSLTSVLPRELAALYRGEILPPLPVQYGDYARWQRKWLQGEILAGHRSFFRDYLAGLPPELDLPRDRPRPAVASGWGGEVAFQLPPELAAATRALARGAGTTPFVVLLTALGALLGRLAGQTSVAVGTPVAGRFPVETEPLVGLFVNTLVLRVDRQGEESFRQLVEQVSRGALQALDRPHLPFELLVEDLAPERSLSASPLFQAMLAFQNLPRADLQLGHGGPGDLRASRWHVPEGTEKFDLTLSLEDPWAQGAEPGLGGEEGWEGRATFATDLFDATTIHRLLRQWRHLLSQALAAPEAPLDHLPGLDPAEAHQLTREWAWGKPLPALPAPLEGAATLGDIFRRRARAEPDSIALVATILEEDHRLTYAHLLRQAETLATFLQARGVGPGTRVGILLPRTPALPIALLGTLLTGAAYVPLDPAYPEERLSFMLQDSGAALCLTTPGTPSPHHPQGAEAPHHRFYLDAETGAPALCRGQGGGHPFATEQPGEQSTEQAPQPGTLAYIIYTSGSTGRPKGVAIEHRSALALLAWGLHTFPRRDLAGVLAATSICFDLSIFELFLPWAAGGKVLLADHALALAELPARGEVTLLNTVPSAITELLALQAVPPSVRAINLAGEPLRAPLAEAIHRSAGDPHPDPRAGRTLRNLYGPSEDTTYSTHAVVPIPSRDEPEPTIGMPLAGTRAQVVDRRLRPVSLGTQGELLLAGAGLARGYLGRPRATAEAFVPDPQGPPGSRLYRTGDRVLWRRDGQLLFRGRFDHQVKVRGFRIELGEIETALRTHPGVRDAVVITRSIADSTRLLAYVVSTPSVAPGPPALAAAELRDHLDRRLPAYMVPAAFLVLAELPLLPNGKIDRSRLPEPATEDIGLDPGEGSQGAPRLPLTPLEERLAEVWREVLGQRGAAQPTALHGGSHFFHLGGQSLLAARLIGRLRQTFGVDLPMAEVFAHPTLRGLAERLGEALGRQDQAGLEDDATPPLVPGLGGDEPPLSFAQEGLWLVHRLAPESPAYNLAVGLELGGSLSVSALRGALSEILRRHPPLRTAFEEGEDGDPRGRVLPAGPVPLPSLDLTRLGNTPEEEERLLAAWSRRPLPVEMESGRGLEAGVASPVARFLLLRLGPRSHLFLIALHHIVADGWSLNAVFPRELSLLYAAGLEGSAAAEPLPEPVIHFGDYAAWQRARFESAAEGDDILLGLAVERLRGAPGASPLPLDHERPEVACYRGDELPVELGSGLGGVLPANSLEDFSQRESVTPFMVIAGALAVALGRMGSHGAAGADAGAREITLGVPVAGREHPATEELIGLFVNTLVLRLRVDLRLSFREHLAVVRDEVLAALAQAEVPFDRLVEALAPARSLGANPLFKVMLAFQNLPEESLSLPGLQVTRRNLPSPGEKMDLTLTLEPGQDGELTGNLSYAADLYERRTVEGLLETLREVLVAGLREPARPLHELEIGAGQETRTPQRVLRDTPAETSRTPPPEPISRPLVTPLERRLGDLWSELLGTEIDDAGAHFFAQGGHSLLAARLLARVRKAYGLRLPLVFAFTHPTLAAQAEEIDRALAIRDSPEGAQPPERPAEVPEPSALEPSLGPREPGAELPLSFGQRRLWLLERLAEEREQREGARAGHGRAEYHIPAALLLRGEPDVAALARALAEIVRRHEVLRTVFALRSGEPVQKVLATAAGRPALPVVDLARVEGLAPAAPALPPSAKLLARAEAARPFDLATGPLLRATLLRLAADGEGLARHLMLLTLHHIAADGGSLAILQREMAELYAAFQQGHPSPLPALPVQYADYALWQHRALVETEERQARELAYWRRQLADLPETLDLPADHPRPAVRSGRGLSHPLRLDPEITAGLDALSRRHSCSQFMLLLAGVGGLLTRASGQVDLPVGSPVAGREPTEVEGLIGFFVNTLVLRVDTGGDPSFHALVSRARAVVLAAFAHQHLPFERLVEELAPRRDAARTPLFQVLLTLNDDGSRGVRLPGLDTRVVESPAGAAKTDLTFAFLRRAGATREVGAIEGVLEASADLFDATSLARIAEQLERLFRGAVAAPDRRLSRLPLLSAAQRHQLLLAWGTGDDTSGRVGPPVAGRIWRRRAARRDALAVIAGSVHHSYGWLERRAAAVRERLHGLGVGPRDLVAVLAERSAAAVASYLGILWAGAAYLPLDPAYPDERLRLMLEDSAAPALLAPPELAARVEGYPGRVIWVSDEGEAAAGTRAAAGPPPSDVLPAQSAYVIYTSGSTGRPKGVEISHRALAGFVDWHLERFDLTAADRATLLAGQGFDASVWEIWPTLVAGAVLLVPGGGERLDPTLLLPWMTRRGVSITFLPTPLADAMTAEVSRRLGSGGEPPGGEIPTSLRFLLTGGDVLRRRPGAGFPYALINAYGPTESTIVVTSGRVREDGSRRLPDLGRPRADTRALILDRHLGTVPMGGMGEIFLAGGGLAAGYHARPGETAQRFIPHAGGERLYRTGDRGRFWADGRLEFHGRTDFQVKVRGVRIELGEVEAVLAAHPGLESAVVVARTEPAAETHPAESSLAAYGVVAAAWRQRSEEELRAELAAHLARHLPQAARPRTLTFLAELPLSPNGKVDRRALPAPRVSADAVAGPSGAGSGRASTPRTPAEVAVSAAVEEVLGSEAARSGAPDLEASFFDLGGHSLSAVRLAARLRDAGLHAEDGAPVSLLHLFEAGSLRELAGRLRVGEGGPSLRPRAGQEPAALSLVQERLWFLDQLAPGSVAYNIPLHLELRGALRVGAFAAALRDVVARHESLRTTFAERAGTEKGGAIQVISPPPHRWPLPVVDLAGLPQSRAEELARRLASAFGERPFDLSRGPLLRTVVGRLTSAVEDSAHQLWLSVHHIVTDGWSMGVLLRDLGAFYRARLAGEEAGLPPLPVQYADFAQWDRERMESAAGEGALEFWRKELSGLPAVLELPTDRPRPPIPDPRVGELSIHLPARRVAVLEALGRQRRGGAEQGLVGDTTLFMVLAAVVQALLGRWTGARDLAFGVPEAGRPESALEDLVGFFVNTLVLRADLSASPSFLELLERTRRRSLDALAHAGMPFALLVDRLAPQRQLAHEPLVQVSFALQNLPMPPRRLPGLELRLLPAREAAAKQDITLALAPEPAGLSGSLLYRSALFDTTTMLRLRAAFHHLLDQVIEHPDRALGSLPLLAESDCHQLFHEWNDTRLVEGSEALLQDLVAARIQLQPDATVIVQELAGGAVEVVTYAELGRRAEELAGRLRRAGVGFEARVGVLMERSILHVTTLLAILRAGAAYVPMDPKAPAERIAWLMEDAELAAVATEQSLADLAGLADGSRPGCRLLVLDDPAPALFAAVPAAGPGAEPRRVGPEQLAYVIYTSGSTGRPKGVAVPHRAAVRLMAHQDAAWQPTRRGAILWVGAPIFDVSVVEVWEPLTHGGQLVLIPDPGPDIELLGAALSRHAVDGLRVVPGLLSLLAELRLDDVRRLRFIYAGGEAVPTAPVRRVLEAASSELRVFNAYGPTENGVITSTAAVSRVGELRSSFPIGRPLADTRVYVTDRRLYPSLLGAPGELVTGGEGLARGYLARPRETAAAFIPDPWSAVPGRRLYRTGDRVRLLADGNLDFLGREDHQVKIRGFRIELGEIEVALAEHPLVREAVVIARPDPAGESRLLGYVTGKAVGVERETLIRDLRATLAHRLPAYMIPAVLMVLAELPRTPTDKVDRRALPEPEVAPREPFVPASDELEATLVGVWEEVLERPRVGIHDNFFEVGGSSLAIVRVRARLREVLERDIPLVELFQHSSVASLAAHLRAGEEGQEQTLERVEERTRSRREQMSRLRARRRKR